jgi:hypothetical protein
MYTFHLEGFGKPVPVTLPDNLTKSQLLDFPAFKTWRETLQSNLASQEIHEGGHVFHKDPYSLRRIIVQSVDWFGKSPARLGFVKIHAHIENQSEAACQELHYFAAGV